MIAEYLSPLNIAVNGLKAAMADTDICPKQAFEAVEQACVIAEQQRQDLTDPADIRQLDDALATASETMKAALRTTLH